MATQEPLDQHSGKEKVVVPETPQCSTDEERAQKPATSHAHDISVNLAELKEYTAYLLAAKKDAWMSGIKKIAIFAVLGFLGAIVGIAILATAGVLLANGIADAFTALFGGRLWAGELVAAVLLLGLVFGGGWFMMKKLTNSWRKATVDKYERRRQEQKARFGRDVKQAAREGRAY
jgi:hypothetical protein